MTMSTKTATSEYLLLFRNTSWHEGLSPEEIQQNLDRFTAWFKQLRKDGKFKGRGPLESDRKIVTDRNVVIDGPFAESKLRGPERLPDLPRFVALCEHSHAKDSI
jgi:hypothetical protein